MKKNAEGGTSPSGKDVSLSAPRQRTYYDDDHDESYGSEYSDDFESDDKSKDRVPMRKRNPTNMREQLHSYSDQSSTSRSHLHFSTSSKNSIRIGRVAYRKPVPKNGWKSHNPSNNGNLHACRDNNITARLLSAKQRQINEIENELAETDHRLESVLKENRLLKTVQHRQDRALRHFQDVESDLPRLISRNLDDQKVLKTRLRKAQESEKALEEKLKENNDEMQKMEQTLQKLKKVIYDKNLGERSELARQLTSAENNLKVAERKVGELEKKLELTTSSFKRQIKTEHQKHKETKVKFDALADEHQATLMKLKEKERALDVSNIYALRNKEPSFSKFSEFTGRSVNVQSSSTQTTRVLPLTDVDKRNEMKSPITIELKKNGQKKCAEMFRVRANGALLESSGQSSPVPFIEKAVQPLKISSAIASNGLHSTAHTSTVERDVEHDTSLNNVTTFQSGSTANILPVNGAIDSAVDNTLDQSRKFVSTLQLSNVAASTEAEKEKKLEDDKDKLHLQQRKKAELLARMREIEDDSPTSPLVPAAVISQPPLAKEVALEISDSIFNPNSKPEFVKYLLRTGTDSVIENLHMGLPSNNSKEVEHKLSFGGYAPSVGISQADKKPTTGQNKRPNFLASDSDNEDSELLLDLNSGKEGKKSDLLVQLFGAKSSNGNDVPSKMGESITPRAKPIHSGYPWEKNVVTTSETNGIVDYLPQKLKTGITVKSSPAILDDDIEELTL